MNCDKCGNPLMADRSSISEMARFGFIGGRIHCRLGCTDLWLRRDVLKREIESPRDEEAADQMSLVEIECRRCGNLCYRQGPNARYCFSCSETKRLMRDRRKKRAA